MTRSPFLLEPRRLLAAVLTLLLAAGLAVAPATDALAQDADLPDPHVVAEDPGSDAIAWVQEEVDTDGDTIRIVGEGWTNQAGTSASTVALKLDYREIDSEPGQLPRQYTRRGADVVDHPSASGDDTIWVLLAPGSSDHPNVHPIAADGSFDVTFDAPDGMEAGQYLSVQFQSGLFQTGDVQRTFGSGALIVGGIPWEGGDDEDLPTCEPTSAAATVEIVEPEVDFGDELHLRGEGWCHPGEGQGGSVIAIKIDEGAYSRLDDTIHQNRTIWAVVTADHEDGTFDTTIDLPDGTDATSTPVLPEGGHTLRLLTGTLKPGDTQRTLRSEEFVVGEYRPVGTPPPVEATEDLVDATRGGVRVARSGSALTVAVPGATAGDWIFLTAYAPDGSPRYPWGATWFQANAAGQVSVSLSGVDLPAPGSKIAVQDGNRGAFGELLGWSELPAAALSCPASGPRFPDVPAESVHRDAVSCLAALGIVLGRADGSFDPSGTVRRDQAASMLARLLDEFGVDLPTGRGFPDVPSDSPHRAAISSLAALGVIQGRPDGSFDPRGSLTRAQTASVLARALQVITGASLPAGPDAFDDDDGSPHEANINRVAAAGIVQGTGGRTYAPSNEVRRDQLASILARTVDRFG